MHDARGEHLPPSIEREFDCNEAGHLSYGRVFRGVALVAIDVGNERPLPAVSQRWLTTRAPVRPRASEGLASDGGGAVVIGAAFACRESSWATLSSTFSCGFSFLSGCCSGSCTAGSGTEGAGSRCGISSATVAVGCAIERAGKIGSGDGFVANREAQIALGGEEEWLAGSRLRFGRGYRQIDAWFVCVLRPLEPRQATGNPLFDPGLVANVGGKTQLNQRLPYESG
jgi:hypothetical protein